MQGVLSEHGVRGPENRSALPWDTSSNSSTTSIRSDIIADWYAKPVTSPENREWYPPARHSATSATLSISSSRNLDRLGQIRPENGFARLPCKMGERPQCVLGGD